MARIIIERECPTCGGRGSVTHPAATEREYLEGLSEDQCPACSSTGAVWGSRTLVDLDRLPSRSIEAAAKALARMQLEDAGVDTAWYLMRPEAEAAVRAFLADLGEETK